MQQAGRRGARQVAATRPALPILRRRALSSKASPPSPSWSSVNQDEVKKFGAYGQGWWDEEAGGGGGGGMRRRRQRSGAGPLHALNPVRVRYIAEAILGASASGGAVNSAASMGEKKKGGLLSGYRLLDVGCGGGLLSEALARLGADVTGLDPSPANIDVARTHAAVDPLTQGIRYEAASVEEFIAAAPAHRRFHAVVASEVIEHVESPPAFLQALAGAVSQGEEEEEQGRGKGGHVVLTTINRTPKAYLIAILGAEHLTGVVPVGTHDWRKFLQPQELARFGRAAGLRVRDVSGLVYNPWTGVWRLKQEDTDVNYAMHLSK